MSLETIHFASICVAMPANALYAKLQNDNLFRDARTPPANLVRLVLSDDRGRRADMSVCRACSGGEGGADGRGPAERGP